MSNKCKYDYGFEPYDVSQRIWKGINCAKPLSLVMTVFFLHHTKEEPRSRSGNKYISTAEIVYLLYNLISKNII